MMEIQLIPDGPCERINCDQWWVDGMESWIFFNGLWFCKKHGEEEIEIEKGTWRRKEHEKEKDKQEI